MISRRLTVTFDAHEVAHLARFWAGMLGREVVEDAAGALLPGDDTQLSLRFVSSSAEKVGPNRMHLHLTSTSPADQQRTVATALGLGGSHLDVGHDPSDLIARHGKHCLAQREPLAGRGDGHPAVPAIRFAAWRLSGWCTSRSS